MTLELDRGSGDNRPRPEGRSHVTVLGTPAARTGRGSHRRPDRRHGREHRPHRADGALPDHRDRPARLRGSTRTSCATSWRARRPHQGVDIAVQAANLLRRGMRLIVMDVDSTLIQGEVIEMLAAHAGCEAEVARVTEQAMRGEIEFAGRACGTGSRCSKDLDASALDKVYDDLALAPGARTTVRILKRLGYRFAMVSGGFSPADRPSRRRARHRLLRGQRARDRRRQAHWSSDRRHRGPRRQGQRPAPVRQESGVGVHRHHRDRRRCQRPRHAQRRRSRDRLQRQARGAGGGSHVGERPLHGRRSSTCSGSAARRSSPPMRRRASPLPSRLSDGVPVACASGMRMSLMWRVSAILASPATFACPCAATVARPTRPPRAPYRHANVAQGAAERSTGHSSDIRMPDARPRTPLPRSAARPQPA